MASKWIQEHKKALIGALLGTAAAFGLLWYLSKEDNPSAVASGGADATSSSRQTGAQKTPLQQQQPSQQNSTIPSSEQAVARAGKPGDKNQRLRETALKIKPKYIQGSTILEMQTISQILEYSIDLAEEDYVDVTLKNRRERRALMHTDRDKYEDLILNYNEQVERVLMENQEQLLEQLNIDKNSFEESVLQLMERGLYQQIYMLQAAIRQKIKEKIKSTKDVSMAQTKEIIRYQVEILNTKADIFQHLIKRLQQEGPESMQMIPLALNTMLQDLIFEKFQIEEEDQMKNMVGPQILTDPDIAQSLMEIETAMFKLMGAMGMGGGLPDMGMM